MAEKLLSPATHACRTAGRLLAAAMATVTVVACVPSAAPAASPAAAPAPEVPPATPPLPPPPPPPPPPSPVADPAAARARALALGVGACEDITRIRTLPFRDELGVDPQFDRMVVNFDGYRDCLVGRITDATPIADPSPGPKRGGYTVGNLAYDVIASSGRLDYDTCLPEEIAARWEAVGAQALVEWTSADAAHREALQACVARHVVSPRDAFTAWWVDDDARCRDRNVYAGARRHHVALERLLAGEPATPASRPPAGVEAGPAYLLDDAGGRRILLAMPPDRFASNPAARADPASAEAARLDALGAKDRAWLVVEPGGTWSPVDMNPYGLYAYGVEEVGVTVFDVPGQGLWIEIVTNAPATIPQDLYRWDGAAFVHVAHHDTPGC